MTTIHRPENLFDGFDHAHWEDVVLERWPAEFESAQQYAAGLSAQDFDRIQRESTARMVRMAEHMTAGTPVSDQSVQSEVAATYAWLAQFWRPDQAAFTALGPSYVEDDRLRSVYDAIAPGLAGYHRDAMRAYAEASLA